jgi:Tfp pilus assembly protein PilF
VGHHPNIVGVQEVFFDEPPYYIVMDYAEGQDLRSWCESQRGVEKVPLETRLEIVAQVADALQAAHGAGVIHRDVKPSNILVSSQKFEPTEAPSSKHQAPGKHQTPSSETASDAGGGRLSPILSQLSVKLTDFGIGQVVSQEYLAGMTRMGFTQTMLSPGSSSPAGTHMYLAPELIAGQPATPRSDIYSLGVVLYQLLIADFGRPLTTDWGKRIEDPLLREDLDKCFAGDAQERFASARDLAQSIRFVGQRRTALAARQRGIRRRRLAREAAITALVLALLFVAGVYSLRERSLGGTKNPDAQYYYDRGKAALLDNTDAHQVKSAYTNFEEAIAFDTNYALAYVGKAFACRHIENLYEPRQGWDKTAFQAAERAIELEPRLADAYVIRGALYFTPLHHWNATEDAKDQRRALKLDRKVKNAHFNLAFVYHHLGFLDQAREELDKELAVDRKDLTPRWLIGATLVVQGNYRAGLKELTSIPTEAFPHRRIAGWERATALFYCGRTNDAAAELNRLLSAPDLADDALLTSVQAVLRAAANDTSGAQQQIEVARKGENRMIHFHHVSYNVASAYALMGSNEVAVIWLAKSAEEGFPCYPLFKSDPNLKNLQTNADFVDFLNQQAKLHRAFEAEFGSGKAR